MVIKLLYYIILVKSHIILLQNPWKLVIQAENFHHRIEMH